MAMDQSNEVSPKFIKMMVNGRWPLYLPEQRAKRPGWQYWEMERNMSLFSVLRPGDLLIDIGVEWGDLSALYASWLGDRSNVILIEPSADMWPWIKAIWEANHLKLPFLNFHGLAGAESDGVKKNLVPFWPAATRVEYKDEPGFVHLNENTVDLDGHLPRLRLDDLITAAGDGYFGSSIVVNMDIEGAEYEVLKGADEFINIYRPIFFISIHPEFIRDRYGNTQDDVIVHLENRGYEAVLLAHDHERHFLFKPKP